MEQLRYGIFYNSTAGDGIADKIADQLEQRLTENHQNVQRLLGRNKHAASAIIQKKLPQLDRLIVIGGDGTINLAVTALLLANDKHVTLGIIPAGTVNNFASRFNLPADPDEAISLVSGQTPTTHVGVIWANQDRAVISSLTFGNLADLSNEVRQQTKRRFGTFSYIWQAIKRIGHNRSLPIRYQLSDGTDQVLKTWFALVTNTKAIGGHVYSAAEPDKMHLSLLNNIHLRQVIPYLFFAVTGRLHMAKSISQAAVTHAIFSSPTSQSIQTRIDGDPGLYFPLELTYLPNRLTLIVPE